MESETLEQAQTRHRRELKDLQGRITGKKKNATKKTRKGVNDECAELERQTKERHAAELSALAGDSNIEAEDDETEETTAPENTDEKLAQATEKLDITPILTSNDAQQPGKKRNRQKERLARRAAEQEAAAIKAEEEASNMKDHRALESEYMKKTFESNKLVEKEIAPDGHCLFSAVADQLNQHEIPLQKEGTDAKEPAYKTVRREATEYMLANADDFAPFLEEDLNDYVVKIRDTAEWGGQLELMALAKRYNIEIRVIQDGRTERIGESGGDTPNKTFWLAYYRHGYGLGEHYNSLRAAS